jgi:hypothetical protein
MLVHGGSMQMSLIDPILRRLAERPTGAQLVALLHESIRAEDWERVPASERAQLKTVATLPARMHMGATKGAVAGEDTPVPGHGTRHEAPGKV